MKISSNHFDSLATWLVVAAWRIYVETTNLDGKFATSIYFPNGPRCESASDITMTIEGEAGRFLRIDSTQEQAIRAHLQLVDGLLLGSIRLDFGSDDLCYALENPWYPQVE